MNAIVTLIIGITAARAAQATFPRSRYFGWAGTLTLGLSGAVIGSVIGFAQFGAEHWQSAFSVMNIWWSTMGSLVLLGVAVIARRSDHAFDQSAAPGRDAENA